MKKYKLASAIVIMVIAIILLVLSIPAYKGEGGGIITFIYGIGFVAVPLLVSGFLKNEKNNLPINKKLHIVFGIIGILLQIICYFAARRFGYFAIIASTFYAFLLLIMELVEMKNQKGFAEKGLALLISIFAILYASCYLWCPLLPNAVEKIVYLAIITILPALLIAKGIVDTIISVKPEKKD